MRGVVSVFGGHFYFSNCRIYITNVQVHIFSGIKITFSVSSCTMVSNQKATKGYPGHLFYLSFIRLSIKMTNTQ